MKTPFLLKEKKIHGQVRGNGTDARNFNVVHATYTRQFDQSQNLFPTYNTYMCTYAYLFVFAQLCKSLCSKYLVFRTVQDDYVYSEKFQYCVSHTAFTIDDNMRFTVNRYFKIPFFVYFEADFCTTSHFCILKRKCEL